MNEADDTRSPVQVQLGRYLADAQRAGMAYSVGGDLHVADAYTAFLTAASQLTVLLGEELTEHDAVYLNSAKEWGQKALEALQAMDRGEGGGMSTDFISHTVRVNVYDGTIRVDLPGNDDTAAWDDLSEPDGGLFNGTAIEPWGVNEENMDRADTALAEFGFERVGPWSNEEYPTATIRRQPAVVTGQRQD